MASLPSCSALRERPPQIDADEPAVEGAEANTCPTCDKQLATPKALLMHRVSSHELLAERGTLDQDHQGPARAVGVQEEAPALGKPVLVLRNNTERPEGLDAGTAILAGTETNSIINIVQKLLNNKNEYEKIAKKVNPYGDGSASTIIYNVIKRVLINNG